MIINGETPTISTYLFNSTSFMVVSGTIDGVKTSKYIDVNTEVEYTTTDNKKIIGLVKSYNSIYDTTNNIIIEVSIGSSIRVIETGFYGTTIAIATDYGNNLNILYSATDVQRHTSITNIDGFASTNETDIVISGESSIILTPQSGVIDGLAFWWSELIQLSIESGSTLPRIDLIVLEKDQSKTTTNVVIKKGTPASIPLTPSVTQTELDYYELPIFSVYVDANTSSITKANIIDLRNPITKEQVITNTKNIETNTNTIAKLDAQVTINMQNIATNTANIELANADGFDELLSHSLLFSPRCGNVRRFS